MADNFLERHREEYEIRKAAWLKKKKLFMKSGKKQKPQTQMPRPASLRTPSFASQARG